MKTLKHFLLLFAICSFLQTSAQVQIGNNIDGEKENDYLGASSSLSKDGSILAVGSPFYIGSIDLSGKVSVYRNIQGNWVQIGESIEGNIERDFFGFSLSLNDAGDILAVSAYDYLAPNGIGVVKIYRRKSDDSWFQIALIDNEGDNFGFGRSIKLNSDGNTLVVASDGEGFLEPGHIDVFRNDGTTSWSRVGQTLNGNSNFDSFFLNVDINSNGNIIAIGSPYNPAGGSSRGAVGIFENINNEWSSIGRGIVGDVDGELAGTSISLNDEGNIIAIGSPGNETDTETKGKVKFYERKDNDSWDLINNIEGDENDFLGTNISMNDQADVITVSSYFANSGNGISKVFKKNNDVWQQAGSTIHGEEGSLLGESTSLSKDGSTVAIGGSWYDNQRGRVKVFDLNNIVLDVDEYSSLNLSIYPNPVKNTLFINNPSNIDLQEVAIYDVTGKQTIKFNIKDQIDIFSTNRLDVSQLNAGVYFINLLTNKGQKTYKLIKE